MSELAVAPRTRCARCTAEHARTITGWCTPCETAFDAWSRQYAADILWQTGSGATIAMLIGLGLPLLGLSPLFGTTGVLVGFVSFLGLRRWGQGRRRRQFLAGSLPRAYLPQRTSGPMRDRE